MPSLVKLYEEYKNDGFVVLAINIREKRAVIEKYARKQAMPFRYFWIKAARSHLPIVQMPHRRIIS